MNSENNLHSLARTIAAAQHAAYATNAVFCVYSFQSQIAEGGTGLNYRRADKPLESTDVSICTVSPSGAVAVTLIP